MNPSVDVGRPPRPFRHLRMAERRSPDPSSSRAPVHSALVQISVTRHHQHSRPAFFWMLGKFRVLGKPRTVIKMENGLLLGTNVCTKRLDKSSRRIFSQPQKCLIRQRGGAFPGRTNGSGQAMVVVSSNQRSENGECCRSCALSPWDLRPAGFVCTSRCSCCDPFALPALVAKLREVIGRRLSPRRQLRAKN